MVFGSYKNLLKSLGFQSFIWTQFLGAFNDNVFKIVISMIAVNMGAGHSGGWYVSLVGAIFIFPFFLFSGYAGFAADVFNKRKVLIVTKSFEIAAVVFGLFAFLSGRIELMLGTLFFMAVHSTFFGPAKYGIVPEMLSDSDLSRANGLMEMSTFLAIILGTSVGSIMYSVWKDSLGTIGLCLIVIAVVGTLVSFGIPKVKDSGADKPFQLNPWGEIGHGLRRLLEDRLLLFTVGGITYFWFLGSLLQMDILLLGKEVMSLSDFWIGILITFLALGIGAGSVVAGKLSGDKVELGLVPIGSIGMGVFSILLAYSSDSYPRTAAALMMVGFFGGLFIVPLNSFLQQQSGSEEKGRIIGTNNFVNTAGILLASAVLWLMRDVLGITAERIVLSFGLLTLASTVLVMKALPDFLVRFSLWMLTHTVYKIRIVGQGNVPFKGPALLVCNHMSFADGLLVGACVQRFVRFMVYEYFYGLPPISWLLRLMKAIPVADGNRREVLASLEKARAELKAGHVVCIFAEGAISRTGNLLPFKKGFHRVVEGLDVPVIPVHLDRVWGSIFSFKGGRFFWKWPTQFPYPVTVSFGAPLSVDAEPQKVRDAVVELASDAMVHRRLPGDMLHLRFMKNAKRHFFSRCVSDSTGRSLTWGETLAGSLILCNWMKRRMTGEDMAAICLPTTVGGALANIGAMMAGKTPVNLNFTAGGEAMKNALSQCGAKTVLTSKVFLAKAGIEPVGGMVFLEDILASVGRFERARAMCLSFVLPAVALDLLCSRRRPDGERLATVVFTTGSEGSPKGVMLTHHNILANIEGFSQVLATGRKDALLGVLPFFHSFGFTATLWFPLVSGFRAVYHPNPMDAKTVGELASAQKATILVGTPTFYSMYARKLPEASFRTIRYAIAGAEKLKPHVSQEFKKRFGVELLEGYGCTEMSPVVSVNIPDIEHDKIRQTGFKAGTVGHPIPGVAVKVVDPETRREVPYGQDGLLLVKGPSLMKGYLGDPALTASVIKDGWYSTGDVASVGEDGFIRIVDRAARFSKVAGEMVAHFKVEETICALLGGCDCVVVSVDDEFRGERVVALYSHPAVEAGELRDMLLKTDLPRIWIPKREDLVRVDSIPVTAAGKVDLKRARAIAAGLAEA